MIDQSPQARIRQLELEKQRLQDQVDELQGALVAYVELPREWKLTTKEAEVFRVLIRRPVVSYDAVMAGLYSSRPSTPDREIVKSWVCRLRKKLGPHGVEIRTIRHIGYAVDDATRAKFKDQEKRAA
jgi:DNA-binding response OmpR family regulator